MFSLHPLALKIFLGLKSTPAWVLKNCSAPDTQGLGGVILCTQRMGLCYQRYRRGAHLGEHVLFLALPQLMLLLLVPLLLLLLQLLLLLVVLGKPSQLLRLLLPARSSSLYVNYRSANNKYFVDSFGMSVQCIHKVETTHEEQKLS